MILADQGAKLDLAEELREEFHKTAKDAVEDAAAIALREVDRLLTQRKGTKKTAAEPGQPPEVDTAQLVASYTLLPGRIKGNVASSGVRSKDPGANRVEFGGTDIHGRRSFPHPAVRLAFENVEDAVTALLEERLP